MRDILLRHGGRSARALPPRFRPLLDRPLLLSDIAFYHVDLRRGGRGGIRHQPGDTGAERLMHAQAGQAFSWWSGMSAAEKAATIDRLKESPTTQATRAEVKRKAKKTPPERSGGAAT